MALFVNRLIFFGFASANAEASCAAPPINTSKWGPIGPSSNSKARGQRDTLRDRRSWSRGAGPHEELGTQILPTAPPLPERLPEASFCRETDNFLQKLAQSLLGLMTFLPVGVFPKLIRTGLRASGAYKPQPAHFRDFLDRHGGK